MMPKGRVLVVRQVATVVMRQGGGCPELRRTLVAAVGRDQGQLREEDKGRSGREAALETAAGQRASTNNK